MRTAENKSIGDRLADRDVGRDMLTSTREPPIPVPARGRAPTIAIEATAPPFNSLLKGFLAHEPH
jgi:hypothetical protein